MELEEKINSDIKESLLKHDTEKLEALRLIKSAVQVEKSKDGKHFLTDEEMMKIIQKLVSQSTDSAQQYTLGNRPDLAEHETSLIKFYRLYLPEQLSEMEITVIIKEIVKRMGATSIRDMGKVMAESVKMFAGRADNKIVGSIVKTILSRKCKCGLINQ